MQSRPRVLCQPVSREGTISPQAPCAHAKKKQEE
jgi:hypothetical protein